MNFKIFILEEQLGIQNMNYSELSFRYFKKFLSILNSSKQGGEQQMLKVRVRSPT